MNVKFSNDIPNEEVNRNKPSKYKKAINTTEWLKSWMIGQKNSLQNYTSKFKMKQLIWFVISMFSPKSNINALVWETGTKCQNQRTL